jgi:hypothetical protein
MSSAHQSRPPRRSERSAWLWLITLIVLASSAVVVWWPEDAERRAIASMPAEERNGLYLRTLANLRSTCQVSDVSLRAYRQQQVDFIRKFPQCDKTCQALAERCVPHATR